MYLNALKISLVFLIISFALLSFLENKYIFWVQIFVIAYGVLTYRKNIVVLIFLLFSFGYMYLPKYHYLNEIPISWHLDYQTTEIFNKLIFLNVCFFVSFFVSLNNVKENSIYNKNIIGRLDSKWMYYTIVLIMIIILRYGIQGDTIIESGVYGQGDVSKSSLHEYFIVFFYAAIVFMSNSSRLHKLILATLLFIFIIKTLIYGGRIEIMQISILALLLNYNFFEDRRKLFYSIIIFFIVVGYIVGVIRENIFIILEPMSIFNLNLGEPEYISSQFGDVNQSSLRVLGLIIDGHIDLYDRIISFISVVFSSIIPVNYLPLSYNLAEYKKIIATSGGGGLISAYSYAWLSYLGPIFFGFYIGKVYKFLYNSNNIFIISYGIIVAISFPRWFAYYPVALFKFSLLIVFILLIYFFIGKILSKASMKNNNFPLSRRVK